MKLTNEQILSKVTSEMPKEYGEKIEGKSSAEVFAIMQDYPAVANSFINTLTNKVTKTLVYSKLFNNPLKELKQGVLEYGDSIEELFVQMASIKGFTGNWDDNAKTPEADLIRQLTPKVTAMYIRVNVDYKGKTTIFDKQLRKAFMSSTGLQGLVMQIVGSITSGMEFKEFLLTKTTLNALVHEGKQIKQVKEDGTIELEVVNTGTKLPIKQTPYIVKCADAKALSKELRETVGLMKFPSNKFNLAKELTWSQPEEMILVTTPALIAELDVDVLASSFNVSKADLNTRTVLVDEMPKGIFKAGTTALVNKAPTAIDGTNVPTADTTKIPKAMLISKDLLQIWDTHQGAGSFYNPEKGYTNHFGNREGIFATCLFENMAIFY